jgi:hypothetical protein
MNATMVNDRIISSSMKSCLSVVISASPVLALDTAHTHQKPGESHAIKTRILTRQGTHLQLVAQIMKANQIQPLIIRSESSGPKPGSCCF